MRKLFLSLVVAIISTTNIFAQSTLVATLSHGTDITMFYGAYALQAAHEAAASGDIINLSGGSFQAVKITKSVILRGAGIDSDNPTCIVGDFEINIPANDANRLSMEGIRCTGENINIFNTFCNPYFFKCQFYLDIFFNSYGSSAIRKSQFVCCKILGHIVENGKDDVQFLNSYVGGINTSSSNKPTCTAMNCVIYEDNPADDNGCQFINCILFGGEDNDWAYFPSSSIATNCVFVNFPEDPEEGDYIFNEMQTTKCKSSTFANVFKNFKGTYSDDQTFELTETAKTQLLGNDGTQVGMYGGIVPYNSTPSYPLITKMNVSNKTTADGKISVEIEVSAAQ